MIYVQSEFITNLTLKLEDLEKEGYNIEHDFFGKRKSIYSPKEKDILWMGFSEYTKVPERSVIAFTAKVDGRDRVQVIKDIWQDQTNDRYNAELSELIPKYFMKRLKQIAEPNGKKELPYTTPRFEHIYRFSPYFPLDLVLKIKGIDVSK